MNHLYHQLASSKLHLTISVFIYASVFYYFGQENLYFGFAAVLGLISFPFLLQKNGGKLQYGYLIAAVFSAVGAFLTGSFSLFYATFVFGLYFLLSLNFGRLNLLPLALLFLISPLVSHVTSMFSFPIRLQLSQWVAYFLSTAGLDIMSEGNLLILAGERFLVDQECTGLKMLLTGLVLALIFLSYYERKYKQHATAKQILLVLTTSFTLNIFANFSRIIILVVFKIGPDHPMHEIVGVLCLLLYNLAPMFLLIRFLKPNLVPQIAQVPKMNPISNYLIWFPFLIFLLSAAGWSTHQIKTLKTHNLQSSILENLNKKVLDDQVIKYSSDDLLIYIKPPVSPIRGTHDPKFCWRGSGYTLELIKQIQVRGQAIYTGELLKGEDKLYTAWWYQDGNSVTNSEWTWRTKGLFDSKAYALINISAETPDLLQQTLDQYFSELYAVQ